LLKATSPKDQIRIGFVTVWMHTKALCNCKSVFDLLKNKNWKEQFQLYCVWFQNSSWDWINWVSRDWTKTYILIPTEPRDNFLYQNNILSTKHNTKQQIVQYIKRMDMIYLAWFIIRMDLIDYKNGHDLFGILWNTFSAIRKYILPSQHVYICIDIITANSSS
jgi:hypothetical protein